MASVTEIINLIDKGVDPAFAASLAGLSLAAAAFFSSTADRIIKDSSSKIAELEPKVEKAQDKGFKETPYEKKINDLNLAIKQASAVQKSLIKAFLIFVWFVVYTITLDQMISGDTISSFLATDPDTQILLGARLFDLGTSTALLFWAGKNLWSGATGIGLYFDVNFEEERDKANKLVKLIAESLKNEPNK